MNISGTIEDLISQVHKKAETKTPLVIAISGFGGAGKSTAASKLAGLLGNSEVISLDDFILNHLSESSEDWDGFDFTRLEAEILYPVQQGAERVKYGVYDWQQNQVVEQKELKVPKYLIIEGIGLLQPKLIKYFDLSVWVDVPLEAAKTRGKTRDREEYKIDHDKQWDEVWSKNDSSFF